MQYLLSQAELDALKNEAANERDELRETLQDLCTQVAIHKPVALSWTPFGCVLDKESDTDYCDACPVRHACPNPNKPYSK